MDKIALIGLGYVGLPLAVEFGRKVETVGFDINESRIQELKKGKDSTLEVESQEIELAIKLNRHLATLRRRPPARITISILLSTPVWTLSLR